ncbi:hypothetical protein NEUTE1DRAFT_52315, partial [Neurospora tetrasperma FGSC 2508]
ETGYIYPTILSDPLIVINPINLITDKDGELSIIYIPEDPTSDEFNIYIE